MKVAHVKLKSFGPYSQSRDTSDVPLKAKEQKADYEKRVWPHKLHCTKDEEVYIPPMAIKNCLSEVAKYLGLQIPGKGKATYTKHFEAGIFLDAEPILLGIKRDAVPGEWVFVPADGVRGSGKRVWKCFPVIKEWSAAFDVYVLDDTITEEAFKEHLEQAGKFIGIGRWRARNNGLYGRFQIEKITWTQG